VAAGKLKRPGAGWNLSAYAQAYGVELSVEADSKLSVWLDELCLWNQKLDLTAARSTEELVDLMLCDALMLAKRMAPESRVVDIGSGVGGPGLALAFLRPDLSMTLVEPLTKRTSFMRTVLAKVNRTDVRLLRERGEQTAARAEHFDSAVSRATLAPAPWLNLGRQLTRSGGTVWLLLGRDAPPASPINIAHYTLMHTGASRVLCEYVCEQMPLVGQSTSNAPAE
jgi:16S rRNA (guanine527-N7)-methyltransferase